MGVSLRSVEKRGSLRRRVVDDYTSFQSSRSKPRLESRFRPGRGSYLYVVLHVLYAHSRIVRTLPYCTYTPVCRTPIGRFCPIWGLSVVSSLVFLRSLDLASIWANTFSHFVLPIHFLLPRHLP